MPGGANFAPGIASVEHQAGEPLRDVQLAAGSRPETPMTIYERRRQNIDRHAAYVVVPFVAGG